MTEDRDDDQNDVRERLTSTSRKAGKRRSRYTETADYLVMLRRLIKAAGRRVGKADMDEFRQLVDLHGALDEAIGDAVPGLRAAGYSWASIGEAVGITKQSAHERWS